MKRQNQPPTSKRQQFLLVALGILLSFAFLEMSLRLSGWVFLHRQEGRNTLSLKQHGDYRILCLGESTTALGGPNAYPQQLENILNSNQKAVRFTVINKGIPSATTTQILAHLNEYLEQYQPQLVVTMIGINDGPNFRLASDTAQKKWDRLLLHLRTYKLLKMIFLHSQHKIADVQDDKVDAKLSGIEQQIDQNPNAKDYVKLAGFYRAAYKYEKERIALQKALKINPLNYEAWAYLGLGYKRQAEFNQALEAYQKAIQLSPDNSDIKIQSYANLGECYQLQGQYAMAEETFREAMVKNPKYLWGLGALGNNAMLQENWEEAIKNFQQQINIDPTAVEYIEKLANCYLQIGNQAAANRVLEFGIQHNPQSAVLYAELGATLISRGRYQEAELVLNKALTLAADAFEGKDINLTQLLVSCYEKQGKQKEAQNLQKKMSRSAQSGLELTAKNYQAIQKILTEQQVPLIAMQYPLRDIHALQRAIDRSGKVILVDNQKIFQAALANKPYGDYFTDRFAGDFGHCTPEGNRLLAQNLANTILQHFFPQLVF
jgi:tetratricopeptide (TPR) repeat protein